jgi:hypothetical protein
MAWVAFAVMLSWFQPTAVQAQAKLNEGEEVRVLFLNTWYEGVVVGREKLMDRRVRVRQSANREQFEADFDPQVV